MKHSPSLTGRVLALSLALSALGLAGCGEVSPPDQDPELTPTTTASPAATTTTVNSESPAPDPTGAEFPVTMERTGGVAGFDDHVTFQADGTMTVRTDRGERTCTLASATRERLTGSLAEAKVVATPTTAASDVVIADEMFQTVSWGGQTTGWNNPGVVNLVGVAQPVFDHVTGREPGAQNPHVTCPGAAPS